MSEDGSLNREDKGDEEGGKRVGGDEEGEERRNDTRRVRKRSVHFFFVRDIPVNI